MLVVLVHRHFDGKPQRVAPALDELERPGRRQDRGVAAAAVLLPLVPHEHELALEDVDLLRVLGLPGHLFEAAAAARADVIGFIENVDALGHRKLGLHARAVASLDGSLAVCLRGTSLLARVPEELPIPGCELPLELGEQLELLGALAFCRSELLLELEHLPDQTLVFALEQLRCLAQLLSIQIVDAERHPLSSSQTGSEVKARVGFAPEILLAGPP